MSKSFESLASVYMDEDDHTYSCCHGPMALIELDELSLVTRYTGMGYNILMANPEGDSIVEVFWN